jgi:hypothetical protein
MTPSFDACAGCSTSGSPEVSHDRRDLLLTVGSRNLATGLSAMALTSRHSHLARRIALMTQRPNRRPSIRLAAAPVAGVVLALAACRVPAPALSQVTTLHDSTPVAPGAAKVQLAATVPSPDRVLVRLTDAGIEGVIGAPHILVYAEGGVSIGMPGEAPKLYADTVRFDVMPIMTLDVTDSDVHLQLVGTGTGKIRIAATVINGGARSLSATGRHIVLMRGGIGVRTGEKGSE